MALLCSVVGCTKPAKTRGWCGMHYQRWRTRGTVNEPPRRGAGPEQMVAVRATRSPPTKVTCKHTDRPHYAKGLCSPCYQTINNKPWRAANRAKLAMGQRARQHGLTPAQLEAMWSEQEGACANPRCRAVFALDFADHRNGLQIDHNHSTNRVRKLLCKACNSTLGHAGDDIERLLGLVEYLQMESMN